MARTGEPRRSKRAQRDAKPGAKRRSEPGRARVFLLLMSCGYCKSPQKHYSHKASHSVGLRAVAIAPTLRARILGGSLPVFSSLRDSTTGYCLSPLRGFEFRSPAARKLFFKFRFIGLPAMNRKCQPLDTEKDGTQPSFSVYWSLSFYLRRRRMVRAANASRLNVAVAGSGTILILRAPSAYTKL